ncbi:hypothetical protein SAMN02745912_02944 [Paramaledivibacter caminithermalis DSM 15212]|uniref:Uncharacterized protein n=1 Tax=Paramaledivibacter caminithermalis (strain DSM 15212 / CIP 107654 / DViRD3) TaxID=1121301 RepID=A0A1M6RG09_PARC5|nr:hypothetical protein SAMN02745912_02944 [Paramaledivibacter caminithermalis DSM 15212]
MNNNTCKKNTNILIVLNIFELCLLSLYMILHSSFFKWSPFYEPLGYQFFLFFYLIPLHLVIGILLISMDRYKNLSKFNKTIPFLASLYPCLSFPLANILHNFPDDLIFIILSLIGLVLFIIFIIIFKNILKRLKES